MAKKSTVMTVTASVVIASSMFGAQTVDAATHKVTSGDNLWALSQKYNTNVAQLKTWNNLSSNTIFPNQVLEVGDVKKGSTKSSSTPKKTSSTASKKSSNSSSSKGASTYKVKRGDTLGHIAISNGISLKNLMKWNNLNSTLIYPGDVLKVSNQSASSNTSSNKSSSSPSNNKGSSTSSNSTASSTYTVKSGDTLGQIAAKHGMSLKTLMNTNNLSSHLIYPGDKLKVGKASSNSNNSSSSSKESSKANSSSSGNTGSSGNTSTKSTYTIKSGDTLGAIASKYGVTVSNLKKWNNLSSHLIYPGEKLTINGSTGTNNSKNDSSKDTSNSPNVSAPSPSGDLISTAKSAIGVPYVWAGTTTSGFDCSGFIYWAYNQSGDSIPRLSTDGYYNRSYMVDKPSVGDLVFFEGTYKAGISHMGIYLGNNKFIQAGSSTGVAITDLDNPYWSKHFHSFKRFY